MVLDEFWSILLDAVHFIYTDHKYLPFATFNCCHILHWLLYMEEYGPTILYHPDKNNIIGDTFSWLLCCDVLLIPVGGMLLLSSSTLPLKVSTSAMTLTWLNIQFLWWRVLSFHIPLGDFCLPSICWLLERCLTEGSPLQARWCQNVWWCTDTLCYVCIYVCRLTSYMLFYILKNSCPLFLGTSHISPRAMTSGDAHRNLMKSYNNLIQDLVATSNIITSMHYHKEHLWTNWDGC